MERKMNIKTIPLLITLLGCSFVSVAATEIANTVEKLYINKSGTVLFKLGVESPSECVDSNWSFGFKITDTSGPEWFQMLHEAKLQGKTIGLGYEENSPSRCTVSYIYYKN
jgi:hypothetical protein